MINYSERSLIYIKIAFGHVWLIQIANISVSWFCLGSIFDIYIWYIHFTKNLFWVHFHYFFRRSILSQFFFFAFRLIFMRFKWEVLRNCPSHWLDEREKAKKVSITNSMFYSRFEWDYLGCIKYLILSTRLLCDFASVRFISFFFSSLSLLLCSLPHLYKPSRTLWHLASSKYTHTKTGSLSVWMCKCVFGKATA